MKVVWAHRGDTHWIDESVRKLLWTASIVSWKVYVPYVRTVLYVDKAAYIALSNFNILGLWDEVNIVNFNEELGKAGKQYSCPKVYAWTLQTEPFWGVDWDTYITQPLPDNLDFQKFMGDTYSICKDKAELYIDFCKENQLHRWYASRLVPTQAMNTGFIYVPNPNLFSVVSLAALENIREMGTAVGPFREWAQEMFIQNSLISLGCEVQPIRSNRPESFFRHEYGKELKEDKELHNRVVEHLGFNPLKLSQELITVIDSVDNKTLI